MSSRNQRPLCAASAEHPPNLLNCGGAPGAASLKAALYPADVPYKFFVAHPDGHHEFRNTYAEHLKAIQFVREAARQDSLEKRRQAAESAGAALDSAMRGVAVPDTAPLDPP